MDEEGNEDRSHSPLSEDKPKTQVSQQSCKSWKYRFQSGTGATVTPLLRPRRCHWPVALWLFLQNVIPQQLLDQYLSMTDPARAQTVDTEIAKHCAFSLPGVALTLGRQNWHCLKDTYETLASDVQVGQKTGSTSPTILKGCLVAACRGFLTTCYTSSSEGELYESLFCYVMFSSCLHASNRMLSPMKTSSYKFNTASLHPSSSWSYLLIRENVSVGVRTLQWKNSEGLQIV